jgi:glucokinase
MAKKKTHITPASVTPLAIGIDIGGTGTKYGIVDRDGNVLFSGEISTKKHKTVDTFIDDLHDAVSELIDKAGGVGRMKGWCPQWKLLYRNY